MKIEQGRQAAIQGQRPGLIIGTIFAAVASDLLLKGLVESSIGYEPIPFLPFLGVHLQSNVGISFSLFPAEAKGGFLLLILAQLAGTLLVGWFLIRATTALERFGLALIVGGAIGNLVDRIVDGAVTDFLHLHPFNVSLFTFNLADVFITLGVCLILIAAVDGRRPAADRDVRADAGKQQRPLQSAKLITPASDRRLR